MTIEIFMTIVKVIMILNGVIAGLSVLFYKRSATRIKLLGLYFLIPLIGYFCLGIFDARGMEVNIPQNIAMPLHFLILSRIYYLALQRRYHKFFLTVIALFLIFAFGNAFFIQGMYFNSYTAAISNVIVIVYCVAYFNRLLVDLPEHHLQRVGMFWFSAAFLIQGAGALFLYLFTAYLTKFFFDDVLVFWAFHNLLIIFQQVLIIIGVAVDLRNTVPTQVSTIKSI